MNDSVEPNIEILLYSQVPKSTDYSSPISPLYSPKSSSYSPTQLEQVDNACDLSKNYVRKVECRKRAYGEEYYIPSVLTAQPKAKILKLEQPESEQIATTSLKKTVSDVQQSSSSSLLMQQNDFETIETIRKLEEMAMDLLIAEKRPRYKTNPIPTPTIRNYTKVSIDYQDIPIICEKCYAVTCFCHLFSNIQ